MGREEIEVEMGNLEITASKCLEDIQAKQQEIELYEEDDTSHEEDELCSLRERYDMISNEQDRLSDMLMNLDRGL